jgi:hypothetical protein
MGAGMSGHTPGPWRPVIDDTSITVEDHDDRAPDICVLEPRDADAFTAEDEANAYLIAAAPELLTALHAAVRTIRTWHGLGMGATEAEAWSLYQASPEMQQINAAIRKAEGR